MTSKDNEHHIWIDRSEIGREKEITLNGKTVTFTIPKETKSSIKVRLKEFDTSSGTAPADAYIFIHVTNPDKEKPWESMKRHSNTPGDKSGIAAFMDDSPLMFALIGIGVIIVGIFLFAGNRSGTFQTFPFAGFITMTVGFFIFGSAFR